MNSSTAISRMTSVVIALMALLGLSALPACATTYSALPISARVVDVESGEPLEDVIVIVKWEYEYLRREISESRGRGTFEFAETMTNRNGEFSFPAWGPKAVPPDIPGRAFMGPNNPSLAFFKPGYLYEVKFNPVETAYLDDRNYVGDPVRGSIWDGKVIGLKRRGSNMGAYIARLQNPGGLPGGGNCNWERIPRMLSALVREGERLRANNFSNRVLTLKDIEREASIGNCRSVQDVLGPFLK